MSTRDLENSEEVKLLIDTLMAGAQIYYGNADESWERDKSSAKKMIDGAKDSAHAFEMKMYFKATRGVGAMTSTYETIGRASEDWQDNALEVFDKLVAVLSKKSIESKGNQTQRLLKLGHTPGIKPRGDIIHD